MNKVNSPRSRHTQPCSSSHSLILRMRVFLSGTVKNTVHGVPWPLCYQGQRVISEKNQETFWKDLLLNRLFSKGVRGSEQKKNAGLYRERIKKKKTMIGIFTDTNKLPHGLWRWLWSFTWNGQPAVTEPKTNSAWNKTKASTWCNLGQESCVNRFGIELADLVKQPGIECACLSSKAAPLHAKSSIFWISSLI